MSDYIAALPMYDWPERRDEVDAEWAVLCDRLRAAGLDAPESLARRNADMPPVEGGIRGADGGLVAPDPATLPQDTLDYPTLWRHPRLLFAQTCWGPLETTGLAEHVEVVGQPDYSGIEGGQGIFYSSAILMRRGSPSPLRGGSGGEAGRDESIPAADGRATLPLGRLHGVRLAYNEPHSMSGMLALARDLATQGYGLDIFSETLGTGGHRASVRAVAEGLADVAAVDCRSWALAQRFEPAARELAVVGWTARRKGLPFIAAKPLAPAVLRAMPRQR